MTARTLSAWLLLWSPPVLAGAAQWSLGPAPAWVAPLEAPPPVEAPARDASPGSYDLLYDHQLRVGTSGSDEYFRRVIQVLSPAGVQDASQLSLDFDPSAERLVLHHVRILRGGRDVSGFGAADVTVIRPERESGSDIYSGTLSALVFLRDVRPGDVLDYAYSLLATAPAPPPSFCATLDMGFSVPVARLRHRLLWPATRTLHMANRGEVAPPEIASGTGETSYTWSREDVPAVVDEDDAPAWFEPYAAVDLSEFDSWAAVTRWAADLYADVPVDPAPLDALLAQWSGGPSAEARALAAVRFVQDDVRYLGLEIGPGAWEPRPPADVLARRYGDCKDKSLLLASLLRRLGLDARPALVSTSAGRALDSRQPSPLAFDHVIVRLRSEGRTLWIDPTVSHQGGRLASLASPGYERALAVDPAAAGLETIPPDRPGEPTTAVEEEYDAPFESAATLSVRVVSLGADADDMRASLAETSDAELARSYLNHYAGPWPGVEAVGPVAVDDRRDEDRMEIQVRYRIPGFWALPQRRLEAWSLSDVLEDPATRRRSTPLAVAYPARLRHRFRVRLPEEPDELPAEARVDDPAFRLSRHVRGEGPGFDVTLDYEALADSVAPEALAGHLADLGRARSELTLDLPRPTGRRAQRRRLALLAAALVPALAGLAALLRARRRRRHRSAGVEP